MFMEQKCSQKKKILIVSFYFPPYAEIAGVRAFKLCKFLPENGWEPLVVTVDPQYYKEKMVSELPNGFEFLSILKFPIVKPFKAKIFASLFFPFYILYQSCKRRKQIDAICMIGSPFHPFILAPVLTKLFNIPTGLDFRDSWSNNFGYSGTARQNVSCFVRGLHWLFFLVERIGIRYASVVSFASPVLKKEYVELHPRYKNKYHVLLNGYDPDDFEDVTPIFPAKGKTILLAGKFYTYTPEAVGIFFDILRGKDDLTFIYIGNEIEQIKKIAIQHGVQDKVVLKPYLPYKEVLGYIKGSDYCLLTNGVVNGIGTKIFDYLAFAKPTLCLVPQGSVIFNVFSDAESVVICERPFTFYKLEEKFTYLLSLDVMGNTSFIEQFSRKKSTKNFAKIYDNILR